MRSDNKQNNEIPEQEAGGKPRPLFLLPAFQHAQGQHGQRQRRMGLLRRRGPGQHVPGEHMQRERTGRVESTRYLLVGKGEGGRGKADFGMLITAT